MTLFRHHKGSLEKLFREYDPFTATFYGLERVIMDLPGSPPAPIGAPIEYAHSIPHVSDH